MKNLKRTAGYAVLMVIQQIFEAGFWEQIKKHQSAEEQEQSA